MNVDSSLSTSSEPCREPASSKRFAAWLLAASLGLVAGCGLFNTVVDPYGLFRWVDRPGFNEIKPRATQASMRFKYRAIDFLLPRTLLLGNSRAEMGWDPDHLSRWRFGPVVNAAMPGTGLDAMVRVADHAWERSRPTTLVIGLEFFDCLEAEQGPAPRPDNGSPLPAGPSESMNDLFALAVKSLSLDATIDSLQTLLAQRNPHAAHLRRDGFQPARDYPRIQAIEGPRKMFLQRDRENARTRVNGPKGIRYGNGRLSECFDALDQLLRQAKARDQVVYLATYPYHARLLELLSSAGLWPAYEDWKTELSRLVAMRQRDGLSVSLRDFGAYHRFAVEPVGGFEPKQQAPKWYWESGHFRAELGSAMLDVLLGTVPPRGLFGIELSPDSIAAHLADVRRSRATFASSQPAVVTEMAAIATSACRPLARGNAAGGANRPGSGGNGSAERASRCERP